MRNKGKVARNIRILQDYLTHPVHIAHEKYPEIVSLSGVYSELARTHSVTPTRIRQIVYKTMWQLDLTILEWSDFMRTSWWGRWLHVAPPSAMKDLNKLFQRLSQEHLKQITHEEDTYA